MEVFGHQKLAKACRKAQEQLLAVGSDAVLPCREPVEVALKRRMLGIIHYRCFDLDSTIFHDPPCDILLNKRFHQPAFWIVAHVASV
jgi:hypothetical protein